MIKILPRIEERGGAGATPSGRTKLTSSLKRRKRPTASGPTSITVLAGAADRSRSRMRGRHFRFIYRCCRAAHPPISINSISSDAAISRCSTGCNRDQTPLSRCVGHRSPLSRSRPTYKEYFPYESQCGRREPRRRHARARPRRVCWPLCAWTIRATIRGARPYGLRCLHWDPGRNAHGVCQMLYRHGWSVTL